MRTEQEEANLESEVPFKGNGESWLEAATNKWQLYAGMALVVTLAIAGYWWYATTQEEHNTQAAGHLARVRTAFNEGKYSNALTGDSIVVAGQEKALGLLEISEQYSGTDAGKVAALMAGNSLVNLGRIEEAKEQFELAQKSDALVVEIGAMKGLAVCMETSNDFAGAAELYEKAAQKASKTGLQEDCLLAAGLCYEKSGDKAKAGQLFTEIVKRFESSMAAPQAKTGLARLGMAID